MRVAVCKVYSSCDFVVRQIDRPVTMLVHSRGNFFDTMAATLAAEHVELDIHVHAFDYTTHRFDVSRA